jgi:hypothetical protein
VLKLTLKICSPGSRRSSDSSDHRRSYRPHSHLDTSNCDHYDEQEIQPEPKVPFRRQQSTRVSGTQPSHRDLSDSEHSSRPPSSRSSVFDGPTRGQRDDFKMTPNRLSHVPTEALGIQNARAQLRPAQINRNRDYISSHDLSSSPEESYNETCYSPATSYGSGASRTPSWSVKESGAIDMGVRTSPPGMKKVPPPPPPSRSKKPPPPPPPMKRSALSSSEVY